jgi:hypothetical protein
MRGRNLGTTPAKNKKRTLRYIVVNPSRVFNWLGMENVTSWAFFPELRKSWWKDDTVSIRKKIQELYIKFFDKETNHFSNLEKSLLKDGFHAPVNTITGVPRSMFLNETFPKITLPPKLQGNPNAALCTHTFGGSRVILAKKHNMDIPCFVYDFTDAFPQEKELNTIQQIRTKFPNSYQVSNPTSQIVVRAIVHTHQPNRRNDGKERDIRHKVINKIRKTLVQEGMI